MKSNNLKTFFVSLVVFFGLSFAITTHAADGKAVYNKVCKLCHEKGVTGAPKLGDKVAWQELVKSKGMDALQINAIKGFKGKTGFMPPKGGFAAIPDDDVKAALVYMVESSK